MADIGFLMVGHGTRSRLGQQQLRSVFDDFRLLTEGIDAELGFLELAEPDISVAVEALVARGIKRLLVIPVLLFRAGHADHDIPNEVELAASHLGVEVIGYSSPLESSDEILRLSAERLKECLAEAPASSTAVALVGRGSSSTSATKAMHEFAHQREALLAVAQQTVCFIHAQSPTVDEALESLGETQCKTVVIQPHLLFEGQLMDDLRHTQHEMQTRHPNKDWRLAEPLGSANTTDRRLAEALQRHAAATLQQLAGNVAEPT